MRSNLKTFTEEVVVPTGEEAQPSEIQMVITTAEKEQPKETKTTEQIIEITPETFTEEVVIPAGEEAQPSEIQMESQLLRWNSQRRPRPLSKS